MPENRNRCTDAVVCAHAHPHLSTLAPTFSQKLATSFMKVILVARKELAAYLVNSALRSSMNKMGLP